MITTHSFTNSNTAVTVMLDAYNGKVRYYDGLSEEAVEIFCMKISPKLQKVDLERCSVRIHHIQKLIERCPNITELGLNTTPLEDNCVDMIIRGFLKTLIKLSLPRSIQLSALHGHQNPRVTGPSKLSLGDLPNLKYFWFRQHNRTRIEEIEGEILRQMLPNAVINQGYLEIANPHEAFWDVLCKLADVFEIVCLKSISLYISRDVLQNGTHQYSVTLR